MAHLKTLPPVTTVEPRIKKHFSQKHIFGAGDFHKIMDEHRDKASCWSSSLGSGQIDLNSLNSDSRLRGGFGCAHLETEGDYYSTMPFGADPPVPHIAPVNITSNGLYNQEIEGLTAAKPKPTLGSAGSSPDIFYR